MLQKLQFPISAIYVPAKRRRELDPGKVEALAEDILENGQKVPIRLRRDGERLILVEGLHRLEACRALGESEITGYLTHAALK
jgi:ParB-like chromosome segregation protein Spo0J